MTQRDRLEQDLAMLTAADRAAPRLWERALGESECHPARPSGWLFAAARRPGPGLVAASLALVLLLGAIFITPSLGRARRAAMSPPGSVAWAQNNANDYLMASAGVPPAAAAPAESLAARSGAADGELRVAVSAPLRHVVRKATIQIETPDVAAAFARAAHSISEARGEYVQDSSISGEAGRAMGTLTLRIAADRLSEALNDLRKLGRVQRETTGGEDVTAQAVDLEARLRNEQRIETELLELLERRADAPLKEILELRESLSRVRQSIEQLTAQQQHLARLVSLATVLVIIRSGEADEAGLVGLGQYFTDRVSAAWHAGLRILADTAGALLRILIGGLPWWVLGGAVVAVAVRWRRRALARGI